jgi:Holliday junction DNA helicase RuvA
MIGSLTGTVAAIESERVVLDVAGVGYEVHVTPKTAAGLGQPGEKATVFTHLHVREDALVLFGFAASSDRELFRTLLTAQGVGPRVALGILAVFSGDALRRAIAAEDVESLTQAPGVGKRTAQRIVLDLKPRLADLEAELVDSPGGQVRQGLEQLGYTSSEIRDAMSSVDPEAAVTDQIRAALKVLGNR